MKFQAQLMLHGKTATGFDVPEEVVKSFGAGKRVPVVVTINGYSYRSTVAVFGGDYMLPLAAEHREAAGVAAGQIIEVELTHDTAPREVEVPQDLAEALAANPMAQTRFDNLSFTSRKEHVRSLEDAKTPETRQRRLEKVLASLA